MPARLTTARDRMRSAPAHRPASGPELRDNGPIRRRVAVLRACLKAERHSRLVGTALTGRPACATSALAAEADAILVFGYFDIGLTLDPVIGAIQLDYWGIELGQ